MYLFQKLIYQNENEEELTEIFFKRVKRNFFFFPFTYNSKAKNKFEK